MAAEAQSNWEKLTQWDGPKGILAFIAGGLSGVIVLGQIYDHSPIFDNVAQTGKHLPDYLTYVALAGIVAAVWLYKILSDREYPPGFSESNIS